MFCSAVRTTLNACNGYECQEKAGIFMVAFTDAGKAGTDSTCLAVLRKPHSSKFRYCFRHGSAVRPH
jgi:hypothetical protein